MNAMRNVRLAGLAALAALVLVRSTPAQVTPPAPAAAASVVQQALAAHGARWATGEIADWTAEGKTTTFSAKGPQATFDMTLTRKGRAQLQYVVKQPAAEVRLGSDGTHTWHSLGGIFTLEAQGHALQFLESQTVRSLQALFNYQAEGLTLRDRGQTGSARVIEAEDRQGRKTSYFVDDRTSTVTRLEFAAGEARDPFSGNMVPNVDSYVLSDYRTVQALLTPFKIERYINGIKAAEMQFSSVRYNASIKDDVFKP